MPSKLQRAIGAVKDQTSIGLARAASSDLDVAVLRATTHDDFPTDPRRTTDVLRLVAADKFHAAACARALGKRIGRTRNWIVSLKSLTLVLRIFQDGDPYFPREVLHAMKRGARILNLASFRDDSSSSGSSPWDFTAFVRTFALYLDERLECFLTGKLQRRYTRHREGTMMNGRDWDDRRRIKGRPNSPVVDMKPAMLLDRIAYWQRLLDRAIATRPTGVARTNRLVLISLYAIVEESFELYRDISDGLTLILDSFFHLQFQNCVSAFQACAKAAKQFKELSNFYALCKSIGVGRSSEYPSVQTISEELIEALREFLKDQSSFSTSGKMMAANRFSLSPPPPPSRRRQDDGTGERSSPPKAANATDGLQCASLEELIKATETETSACPAISIDLEAYSEAKQDEAFRLSDVESSARSLPVSNSMVDLVSLWDWSEQGDENEEQKQKVVLGNSDSSSSLSASKNWEIVLAETLSSTSSTSPNVCQEQSTALVEENNQSTTTDSLVNGWEVVLFEAAPQQPYLQQPLISSDVGILPPVNNYYNPFLQDTIELSNAQPVVTVPTFHAVPSFSIQNQTFYSNRISFAPQNEISDPFGAPASFSSEQHMLSSSVNQMNLLHEQQLWLQNQNKIIGKHMSTKEVVEPKQDYNLLCKHMMST